MWRAWLLLFGFCSLTGAQGFTLRGQLVNTITGEPLVQAEVHLSKAGPSASGMESTTDAQGRFAIQHLAAGEYLLFVSHPGFGSIYYGMLPDSGTVETIFVGPDTPETNIFRITPAGEIRGTVRDEFGDPVAASQVRLLYPKQQDGVTLYSPAASGATDDRGFYRLRDLRPGRYFVCAISPFALGASADSYLRFSSEGTRRFYGDSCAPAQLGANARPMTLAAGQRETVDLTMVPSQSVQIHGQVTNVPAGSQVMMMLYRTDFAFDQMQGGFAEVDPKQQTFVFRGALPGSYRLAAWTATLKDGVEQHYRAETHVTLGTTDLDNLLLTLEPSAILPVRLHIDSKEPVNIQQLAVSLRPEELGTRQAIWLDLASQKEDLFRFTGAVMPGQYRLVTRSAGAVCRSSAQIGGKALTSGLLTLSAGDNPVLDIAFGEDCGQISGKVLDDKKAPVRARVAMLISGTAEHPGDVYDFWSKPDGTFEIKGMPPGRYLLRAWRETMVGDAPRMAAASVWKERTEAVTVEAHQTVKVQLSPQKGDPE